MEQRSVPVSIIVGVVVLAASLWFVTQTVWDSAGSGLFASLRQHHLAAQLDSSTPGIEAAAATDIPVSGPPAAAGEGDPVARIVIPAIDVNWVVVYGASKEVLKSGPGWLPFTVFPGDDGNATISGHRTTYGAPFNRLGELVPGDKILVMFPDRPTVTYVVAETFEVDPSEMWVTDPTDTPMLTLTTCAPEGSAKFRLVIRADRQVPVSPTVTS